MYYFKSLLIIRSSPSDPNINFRGNQFISELFHCFLNTSKGGSNICEVGNPSSDNQNFTVRILNIHKKLNVKRENKGEKNNSAEKKYINYY